jgi:hypothetical protein
LRRKAVRGGWRGCGSLQNRLVWKGEEGGSLAEEAR